MKKREIAKYLAVAALAAALMLAAMMAVSLLKGGTTAQDFEGFQAPASFAQQIAAADSTLRSILTFDYLFILSYTAAFVFLASWAWKEGNRGVIAVALGALLATSLLDFHENHRIMTFLAMAKDDVAISPEMLYQHSVLSQLKFHSSYLGFFLFAFVLPSKTRLEQFLRWSLWLAFPPIGILVYTFPLPIFELLRYVFMLSGLALLAWVFWRRSQKKG